MHLNYNTVIKKAFEINNNKFCISVQTWRFTYPVTGTSLVLEELSQNDF